MEADHRLAEQRCIFWMMCEIIEEWHTLRFVKARFARLNRVDHIIPSTPLPGTAENKQGRSCRARRTGLQRLA